MPREKRKKGKPALVFSQGFERLGEKIKKDPQLPHREKKRKKEEMWRQLLILLVDEGEERRDQIPAQRRRKGGTWLIGPAGERGSPRPREKKEKSRGEETIWGLPTWMAASRRADKKKGKRPAPRHHAHRLGGRGRKRKEKRAHQSPALLLTVGPKEHRDPRRPRGRGGGEGKTAHR